MPHRWHHGSYMEYELADTISPSEGELAVCVMLTIEALRVELGAFQLGQEADLSEERRVVSRSHHICKNRVLLLLRLSHVYNASFVTVQGRYAIKDFKSTLRCFVTWERYGQLLRGGRMHKAQGGVEFLDIGFRTNADVIGCIIRLCGKTNVNRNLMSRRIDQLRIEY